MVPLTSSPFFIGGPSLLLVISFPLKMIDMVDSLFRSPSFPSG